MKKTPVATVTNLTELLRNESTGALLTVNGFSEQCSDFEWLQRLCTCVSRMPETSVASACREILFDLLGAEISFDLNRCGEIWQATADHLFWNPQARERFNPQPSRETVIPQALRIEPINSIDVGALLLPKPMGWKAWEAEAERMLEETLPKNSTPLLHISLADEPKKPNLYRVERILSGAEEDPPMWQVQLSIFVLRFCERRGLRPILEGDCTDERMLDSLRLCASFTSLPRLILRPIGGVSWERYVSLCGAVRTACGKNEEGVPPVLLCGEDRFLGE